mgnify:CR=1 FL=1
MGTMALFALSAFCWALGFGGFVLTYGPMALLPRQG